MRGSFCQEEKVMISIVSNQVLIFLENSLHANKKSVITKHIIIQ